MIINKAFNSTKKQDSYVTPSYGTETKAPTSSVKVDKTDSKSDKNKQIEILRSIYKKYSDKINTK